MEDTTLSEIQKLAGNDNCLECGTMVSLEWASVSFGAVLCLQCSGRHRALGVGVYFVRSLTMDDWTPDQIACLKR
jgi:ADP-ribosylation factor GTPase-activating protein 1